jgi:hypothetical protein
MAAANLKAVFSSMQLLRNGLKKGGRVFVEGERIFIGGWGSCYGRREGFCRGREDIYRGKGEVLWREV